MVKKKSTANFAEGHMAITLDDNKKLDASSLLEHYQNTVFAY